MPRATRSSVGPMPDAERRKRRAQTEKNITSGRKAVRTNRDASTVRESGSDVAAKKYRKKRGY